MVGLKPDPCLQRGFKDKSRLGMVASYSCFCGNPSNVHHLAGIGNGKKASDLLTMPLCHFHHQGEEGIHLDIAGFEEKHGTQYEMIDRVNEEIFKDFDLKPKDLERYYLIKNYCENKK
ncbi:MAG: hypothetical protein ACJAW3_001322 [Lentimonas sp.]|jgi:hypothetical protein